MDDIKRSIKQEPTEDPLASAQLEAMQVRNAELERHIVKQAELLAAWERLFARRDQGLDQQMRELARAQQGWQNVSAYAQSLEAQIQTKDDDIASLEQKLLDLNSPSVRETVLLETAWRFQEKSALSALAAAEANDKLKRQTQLTEKLQEEVDTLRARLTGELSRSMQAPQLTTPMASGAMFRRIDPSGFHPIRCGNHKRRQEALAKAGLSDSASSLMNTKRPRLASSSITKPEQ